MVYYAIKTGGACTILKAMIIEWLIISYLALKSNADKWINELKVGANLKVDKFQLKRASPSD